MEILWWLAFPLAVTLVAMLWAVWAGRPEREPSQRDTDRAYERFAAAVAKPHPTAGRRVPPAPLGRVTGVAVRRKAADDRLDAPATWRDARR